MDERQRKLEVELAEQQKVVEQARSARRKEVEFDEERVRLAVELEKLRRILPPKNDEAATLKAVTKAASIYSVSVVEMRHVRNTPEAPLLRAEYQLTVKGTLQAVHHFFDELRNASLIVNAPAISLRREGAEWVASARLTTFSLGS